MADFVPVNRISDRQELARTYTLSVSVQPDPVSRVFRIGAG